MIKVITPPAAYPATLAEVKEWCRIDTGDTSQDATLNLLIAMATGAAEDLTGRAFVERTLELNISRFDFCIDLPWAPLIGVDSIKYTDYSGAEQTIAASQYELDTVSQPGKVKPVWGAFWPVVGYTFNAVRIRYRAGYAYPGSPVDLTDNSYLPPELRQWLMSRMSSFYENRSQFIIGNRLVDVQVPRDFADGVLDGLMIGTRYF